MFNRLKKLIEKKYYPTKEVAQDIVDTLYVGMRLTSDQYTELAELVSDNYPVAV